MLAGAAWHWPAKCLVTPSIADWLLSDRASPSIGWSVLPSVRRYVPRKKINITFFEENKQSQCKWWCVSMTLHLYEGHPFISFFFIENTCPSVHSSVHPSVSISLWTMKNAFFKIPMTMKPKNARHTTTRTTTTKTTTTATTTTTITTTTLPSLTCF